MPLLSTEAPPMRSCFAAALFGSQEVPENRKEDAHCGFLWGNKSTSYQICFSSLHAADMQASPAWYSKINLFQADASHMRLVDRQLGYLVGSIVAAWGFWCEGCGWEAASQPTGCDVGSKLEALTSLWTEAESPRAAWRTAAVARPQVAALNPACRSKQETRGEWQPGADDDTAGGILEVIRKGHHSYLRWSGCCLQ